MSATAIAPPPAPKHVPKPKKYGPFRVLAGVHIEDHPDGGVNADGSPREITYTTQSKPFYSSKDLTLLNCVGIPPKFGIVSSADSQAVNSFDQLPGETNERYADRLAQVASEAAKRLNAMKTPDAPSITAASIDAMSLKDLQRMAEEEEIDLKGAKTPQEAAKIVKAAFGIK